MFIFCVIDANIPSPDSGFNKTQKKGKAYFIAPLQPPTLASVKTWGNSEGAGRKGLSRCKSTAFF